MISDVTIRQVQVKLNCLSLYVLGRMLAKCARTDPFYQQVLLAMAPELDGGRQSDRLSFDALAVLADGKWPQCPV